MSDEVEIWETIESREVADCRIFRVRENLMRSGDKEGSFFVIENPDWVNVVALTPAREVVMIEQFRQGIGEVILEIPGGIIDAGEEPEAAARRELAEETGFTAETFQYLGRSRPNPAIQNNWVYHFAAVDAEKTVAVAFDEHESLATRLVPLSDVPQLVQSGAVTHSLVLAAFHYFSFFSARPEDAAGRPGRALI